MTETIPLRRFFVTFQGRKIGAIGAIYSMKESVDATDEKNAREVFLATAYSKYEHVAITDISESVITHVWGPR